jgi:ectoine hydroxylase-related dioxygenase (phytanoyl-CoA dioxygenase family)
MLKCILFAGNTWLSYNAINMSMIFLRYDNQHAEINFKFFFLKKSHALCLQDKYDMAASAAPRCIAVEHIAAFWKETSRREPHAASTSCNTSNN